MARFKVIKGGTLLVAISVVILLAVVAIIAVSYFTNNDNSTSVSTGAEAAQAFAPAAGAALALDPSAQPAEDEHTDGVSIESVVEKAAKQLTNGKRILIYHTHTHEAYEMDYPGEYVPLEEWRTDDEEHNIVKVGTELAALLEARGFTVVHDTSDNEQDDLANAYVTSLQTLSAYDGESFDLYIDLHRDAYTEGQEQTVAYDGKSAAKMMMLIGSGDGFAVKPFFEQNYAFACALTDAVNGVAPGLCRDVLVKSNRYNQHIGEYSILLEVGNNENTLQEALAGLPALADGIAEVLNDDTEELVVVSQQN